MNRRRRRLGRKYRKRERRAARRRHLTVIEYRRSRGLTDSGSRGTP